MATFPSLLNVGEPLIFQSVPTPRTVSPFASQLASTGLLPLPAVPAPAPVPAPIAAPPAPAPAAPLLSSGPNFRRSLFSFRDSQTPTDAVAFTSATSAPSTSALGAAEAFGLTAGTPDEIASAYATQRADEVSPRMGLGFGDVKNVFSQPLSKTLDQVFSRPEAVPGAFLGKVVPGATTMLSAMSNLNERNQAYNRAMAEMGQPGYSYGTIDGQQYSISPGPFGYGRVMSGVVPDWFDIDMHDKMEALELGIEPGTGETLSGFTPGIGGYNSQGNFVDGYGNVSAHGTMGNLATLADQQFNGNIAAARNALTLAREGIKPLIFKQRSIFDYEPDPDGGFDGTGGYGSGGVDEDAFSDAVTTAAFDAFGAAFDDAANDAAAADAAAEDADMGFGDDSDW